jgi:endonuclease III-like uncharacterized protein
MGTKRIGGDLYRQLRWEIMLGRDPCPATQWERVEHAIQQLNALDLVNEHALADAPVDTIVEAIRGCYTMQSAFAQIPGAVRC